MRDLSEKLKKNFVLVIVMRWATGGREAFCSLIFDLLYFSFTIHYFLISLVSFIFPEFLKIISGFFSDCL